MGMNKQMVESMSPSDKRKMSPGQEKAALWPKKKKKKRNRQCKERGSWQCLCLHALEPLQKRSCAGAKLGAFPHRHGSWKEDLGEFSQNCKEIHPCHSA